MSHFLQHLSKKDDSTSISKINKVKLTIPYETRPGPHFLRIAIDGAISPLRTDQNPQSSTIKDAVGPYVEVTR